MFLCKEMDCRLPLSLQPKTDILDKCGSRLDLGAKAQLSVNIYDLLFTTYHLMAASDVHFPTVQGQHQLSTLRKMMTSTSARPGTLVESF